MIEDMNKLIIVNLIAVLLSPVIQSSNSNNVLLDFLPAVRYEPESFVFWLVEQLLGVEFGISSIQNVLLP